jgi:hypothetical protein
MNLVLTDTSPPSLPPAHGQFVTCVTCGCVQLSTEDWKCSECDASLEWGIEIATCKACGQDAKHRRHFRQLRPLCECHLTEAQKARLERQLARQREKDQAAALERQERELNEQRRKAQAYHASKCWHESDYKCEIGKALLPFGFCSVCPRFDPDRKGRVLNRPPSEPTMALPPAEDDPRFKNCPPMEEINV